jgi:peptidoglycan biosynthesis protein MviN/MurJ (putative lipid II flippase)
MQWVPTAAVWASAAAVPAWKAGRLAHLAHLQAHHSNAQVNQKTNDGIRLLLLAALVTLLTLLLFSLMVSTLFGQRTNV